MKSQPQPKRWTLKGARIERRVLQADPGQEYFVYIPETSAPGAPMLVAVHGISRNAREIAKLFSAHADTLGVVVVAPLFSIDRFADYQRLGRPTRSLRADLVLDSIVHEVAWLSGASTAQLYLFGYSGGAQFVHRYAMAYPHRIARCVIASAGWYTYPDPRQRFPYGIRPSKDLPSLSFDPEEFLRVPMHVIVGAKDVTKKGLRDSRRVNRQQGLTRVERAKNWVEVMRAAALAYHCKPQVEFESIPGGHHSFRFLMERCQLGDRVFRALFGPPQTSRNHGNHTPHE
jgi:pimeloyl-ACP methyl ester carboxylesterase